MARRTCFVISPVGDPGSPVRKRADQVFKHIIEPVTLALHYRAKRADLMKRPGLITSKVLTAVVDSDLVVADLTGHDAAVFYELAIRHAAQRPVVQLIDAAQELPFDTANMRTIFLDIHDLDSAEAARNELTGHVRDAEADPSPVQTPVLAAKSMRSLWDSEVPTDRFIAEALEELRALKRDRRRRDQHARRAVTASGTPAELIRRSVAPSAPAVMVPKVNLNARPSTLDFGADLFASTKDSGTADEHDASPEPRASLRKSRKSNGDVSRRDQ
jgi:hypothetical protein